jgi:hypothetical protein
MGKDDRQALAPFQIFKIFNLPNFEIQNGELAAV